MEAEGGQTTVVLGVEAIAVRLFERADDHGE